MLVLLLLVAAFINWNIEVLARTPPTPKQLKSSAITALEHISTTDHRLQRTLERAVKNIGRSSGPQTYYLGRSPRTQRRERPTC